MATARACVDGASLPDARALLQGWQGNRERLVRYTGSLIPLAGERTAAATAAYRGGRGTLTAVLEARVAEIETRMNKIQGMEKADEAKPARQLL